MRKEQFLQELRGHLAGLPVKEVDEILRDQEEYIRDAVQAGRDEELVVRSLGSPKVFAAGLTADFKIQKAQNSEGLTNQASNVLGAMFAILALAPLNLIFVLGPFIALCATLFAGWAVEFAFSIAALALIGVFFFKLVFISAGFWMHLSAFFFCLGWIGACVLGAFIMYHVTRFFIQGTLAYLKWNLSFVKSNL